MLSLVFSLWLQVYIYGGTVQVLSTGTVQVVYLYCTGFGRSRKLEIKKLRCHSYNRNCTYLYWELHTCTGTGRLLLQYLYCSKGALTEMDICTSTVDATRCLFWTGTYDILYYSKALPYLYRSSTTCTRIPTIRVACLTADALIANVEEHPCLLSRIQYTVRVLYSYSTSTGTYIQRWSTVHVPVLSTVLVLSTVHVQYSYSTRIVSTKSIRRTRTVQMHGSSTAFVYCKNEIPVEYRYVRYKYTCTDAVQVL